jgi:hypothetical protein
VIILLLLLVNLVVTVTTVEIELLETEFCYYVKEYIKNTGFSDRLGGKFTQEIGYLAIEVAKGK